MLKEKYFNIKYSIPIIDVRSKYEFSIDHFPGSLNIPYDELISYHKYYLNKNDTYYIACKTGVQSKSAVSILEYLGYNVIMLEK